MNTTTTHTTKLPFYPGAPAGRIVILGAAESGIGAAILAQKEGHKVFVSDGGVIKDNYKKILEDKGIEFEEGGHTEATILAADCVVKSPGIPEKAEIIKKLRAAEVFICSEIEFGSYYNTTGKVIAITGSNGKSTTTKLLYHTLQLAGYDVSMVGNIGISFAKQIAEKPTAWYVMEISSFQLDDIYHFRPDMALILNITPDHLDRYQYKMENYVASKFRIAKNQTKDDLLILNKDDKEIQHYLANHSIEAKNIFFTMNEPQLQEGAFMHEQEIHIALDGEDTGMSIHDLSIKGKHNQYNSMAAGISARAAGIRRDKIRESFATFHGLEHRLEFVATVRGVDFVNDSKATNLNSVWYALESMTKPTILILGGQDKGNDYDEIKALVSERVKAIICIGVDNAPIHQAFADIVSDIVDVDGAKSATKTAYTLANPGDVVLLAPGCASFDRFKNFEDRGAQFKQAVKEL